jgi:uncharacterized protein (TIGR03118 family)
MNKTARFSLVTIAIAIGTLYGPWRAEAEYIQTNLVSDIQGLATILDTSLVNPWGISHSATSPFWVSNQVTNTATLYAVTGSLNTTGSLNVIKNPLTVDIPTTSSVPPQGPTGQVNNTGTSFPVGAAPASFIFANLNGTISAWNNSAGTTAVIQATTPGAVYTGLAINQAPEPRLYAARAGGIDVFNGLFQPATNLPANAFATPAAAAGLVPFNVQTIGGNVAVTYAPAGVMNQRNATPGMGAVAIFDASGNFLRMAAVGGPLAAPWGIALAPTSGFGQFSGDLLVGNFSFLASEINAFDPTTGMFLGTIPINVGVGNTPGGLWALGFGIGGNNGSPDTLFFTDGINGETHGLFGAISFVVPGPIAGAGLPGLVAACGGLLALARRRRKLAVA